MENTFELVHSFIGWRDNQIKTIRGGKTIYDIKDYHKFLNDSELFDFWLKKIHKKECVTY